MEIEQRLAEIDRKQDRTCLLLEQLASKVEERASHSDLWRERVERTVWGFNGTVSNSLVVRLDRLEQVNKQQMWVIRIAAGVILTGIIGGVWSLLTS